MNAAEILVLLGVTSSASGSSGGIPANALYDDDALSAFLDDDNATFMTDDA